MGVRARIRLRWLDHAEFGMSRVESPTGASKYLFIFISVIITLVTTQNYRFYQISEAGRESSYTAKMSSHMHQSVWNLFGRSGSFLK